MDDPINLSKKELKDILSLSQRVLRFSDFYELGKEVLQWLIQYFECISGGFCLIKEGKLADMHGGIYHGISNEEICRYADYFHPMDPIRSGLKPEPTVATTTDFISLDDLVSTEYYKDYMQQLFIHYEMQIRLKLGSQFLGIVFIHRSPKQKPFSLKDRIQAELIAPHLTQAVQNVIITKHLKIQDKLKDILMTQMPCQALLILDQDLEPVYVSDGFFKVFSGWQGRGSSEPPGDFQLPSGLTERCRQLMDTNERIFDEDFQTIEISQDKGRNRLSINLLTLNQKDDPPMFLISFLPHESFLSHSEPLQRMGLSKRELEVISLLFLGLKNTEIGARLFISVLTVENHLRTIYTKLQVRNRTSVLHRVLNLISPLYWPNR